MAKYMVTGALAQIPGVTADGQPALVYAYRGAVVDLDAADAEHNLSVGLLEKLDDVDDDPTVAAGGGPLSEGPVTPLHPALDAGKAEWVAHAIRSGLAESDAEAASREDLVAIFTGDGLAADEEPDVEPVKAGQVQPAKAATKAAWVDFAVAKGADRAEVEKASKDDLIATYGT